MPGSGRGSARDAGRRGPRVSKVVKAQCPLARRPEPPTDPRSPAAHGPPRGAMCHYYARWQTRPFGRVVVVIPGSRAPPGRPAVAGAAAGTERQASAPSKPQALRTLPGPGLGNSRPRGRRGHPGPAVLPWPRRPRSPRVSRGSAAHWDRRAVGEGRSASPCPPRAPPPVAQDTEPPAQSTGTQSCKVVIWKRTPDPS